jgi:integrase/recombinase XerD
MERGLAPQSVVQQRAMVDRFNRYLRTHGVSLADFESHHIEAFWSTPEADTHAPGTRTRYLKLLDRLCQHLVAIGVRESNPASRLASSAAWPARGAVPPFLSEAADLRLQRFVQPDTADGVSMLRRRAVVAIFLGTGITAREGRSVALQDIYPTGPFPHLYVHGARGRPDRRIPLESFAMPALEAWQARRRQLPILGDLLFALRASGEPITDMSFGIFVRDALNAIGQASDDMGPRILRNTYCRRLLIAGVPRERVSELLGLTSTHTCEKIQATIDVSER